MSYQIKIKSGHCSSVVLWAACFCFVVYDNYLTPPGVRVFDIIGFFLVFWLVVTNKLILHPARKRDFAEWISVLIMVSFIAVACIQGLLLEHSLASVPFILGVAFFFALRRSLIFVKNLSDILAFLLFLCAFSLIAQFLIYLATNRMLSFVLFDDGYGLRSSFGGILHRPTGLFIEPSSHATAVIMLLWPYIMIRKKIDRLVILSCVSILISQSILGVVYVITLIFSYGFFGVGDQPVSVGRRIKILFFCLLLTSSVSLLITTTFSTFDVTIIQRVAQIMDKDPNGHEDGSYRDRVESLVNGNFVSGLSGQNVVQLLIGHGISSEHFQKASGANTIGWLIVTFGVFGGGVILFYLAWLVNFTFFGLTFIAIMMVPYPLASYGFMWLVLAALYANKCFVQQESNLTACCSGEGLLSETVPGAVKVL